MAVVIPESRIDPRRGRGCDRAGDRVGHGTGKCAGPTLRSEDRRAMSEIFVATIRRNRANLIPQSKKKIIPAATGQL